MLARGHARCPVRLHHRPPIFNSDTEQSASTSMTTLHQAGLHRPKDTTSSCTTTSSYVKNIVEFYIANKNIAKVYIHVVFRRRRRKLCRRRDL
jgi:hypothetical protein